MDIVNNIAKALSVSAIYILAMKQRQSVVLDSSTYCIHHCDEQIVSRFNTPFRKTLYICIYVFALYNLIYRPLYSFLLLKAHAARARHPAQGKRKAAN